MWTQKVFRDIYATLRSNKSCRKKNSTLHYRPYKKIAPAGIALHVIISRSFSQITLMALQNGFSFSGASSSAIYIKTHRASVI